VIRALARADAQERAFWERTIGKGQQESGDLDHAMTLMQHHGTLASTRQSALDWAQQAKQALSPVPASALKELLGDLADFVVERVN
jgi:octaprenyl-diphosphate synthase